ncbi:hypothetical protein K432DRAFT_412572 [Lepidopterella palustris CBS 459.81]|uniref:Uncharacterized protein n=1 Tax=Lepidopterella palustris CBS 459.81 TaxID=1314670 RepID=A0A8E2J7L5_9PEZI|nr:hypothetical protein K432DRAFT_412572 [Lepidopterella palustris CBS 459.81]
MGLNAPTCLTTEVIINSRRATAVVDSGAEPPAYRNGIINLETEEVKVDTKLGIERRCFNILDLGETEILLGWD